MRVYIEAIEKMPPDSIEEPEFIRIDITRYSEQEIDEVIVNVKELMKGLITEVVNIGDMVIGRSVKGQARKERV